MKKAASILLICFIFITGAYAKDKAAEGIWIDVRTVAEYSQGHKDDAINIPHTKIRYEIAKVTTNKEAKIHLYCAAGVRAGIAKSTLERMGYQNVINEGGLSDIQ